MIVMVLDIDGINFNRNVDDNSGGGRKNNKTSIIVESQSWDLSGKGMKKKKKKNKKGSNSAVGKKI